MSQAVRAAAVLMLVTTTSCSSGPSVSALIEYAEGDWDCVVHWPSDPFADGAELVVTVTPDSETRGTWSWQWQALGAQGRELEPYELEQIRSRHGEWRLDGSQLTISELDQFTEYVTQGVAVDTDHIVIQQEEGEHFDHKPQPVDVARGGDAVTFSWNDPSTDDEVRMPCTKSQ